MKRAGFVVSLTLAWLTMPAVAPGQQAGVPEPIVRASIAPPRVVVGQATTLRIEVLAPNYMTAPPAFPDLQNRNAVTRELGTVNISEQRDGETYAGMRRELGRSFRLVRIAWALLVASLVAALAVALDVPFPGGATLFGLLVVAGWLLTFLLGILQRCRRLTASRKDSPRSPAAYVGSQTARLRRLVSPTALVAGGHSSCPSGT